MKKLLLCVTVLALSQLSLAQESKQAVAQNWLSSNVTNLQANQGFDMNFSRAGRSGETFRFYHTVNGVEVFDSSYAIHVSNNNEVTYHSTTFDRNVETIDTNPTISETDALQTAIQALNVEGGISQQEVKLYVYNKFETTKLVYRVTINSEFITGHWEAIIDAKTNEVLSTKDIAIYENGDRGIKSVTSAKSNRKGQHYEATVPSSTSSMLAPGTALIFDPDPLTKTTNLYGGNFSDNNDNTNADLDAARTQVNLVDIDFDGSLYTLKGPYVEIAQLEAPSTGLFQQASPDFNFNRQEQGFEAANCFHHLDQSFRYINDDLGIPLVSIYNGGVLRYDPHGLNGADNSYYSSGNLVFGEGGVDDAEDMDVVLHELGHGLHDFITNGGLSNNQGLSEGTGDYWANSYKRSLGFWDPADASYYYVFGWDGHNPFWPGRVTNYGAQYPGGLTGSIHTDGQIWASTLLEIWEIIGREKTDAAVWEGIAMTSGSTNQQNAAIAVRQAAIDMGYSCADIDVFTDRFEARGYVLPTFVCGGCNISDIATANLSPCDDNGTPNDMTDDTFTADVIITFTDAVTTGTLDLTGDGTASVSVTGLNSPYTFTGVTMSADGGPINLTATFSDDTNCTGANTNAGTAPENCSTLGIDDIANALAIVMYPNPAEETILFENINERLTVTIFNLLGQKVMEQSIDTGANSMNVTNLANGTYLVKFEGYGEVRRLVKK